MTGVGLEFTNRYQEIGRSNRRREPISPAADLHAWRQFVNHCTEGYEDNLAEYQADLWIRRNIQLALDDKALQSMEGFSEFFEIVHQVDEKFKSIATVRFPAKDPSKFSWWNLIVPRYGGEEFAADLRRECGIAISVIP